MFVSRMWDYPYVRKADAQRLEFLFVFLLEFRLYIWNAAWSHILNTHISSRKLHFCTAICREICSNLHIRNPIGTVFGCQSTTDQQNDVNYPPNAHAAKRKKLSNCCSSLTQTKPVNTQKSEQNTVDQSGGEIMACIPKEGKKNKLFSISFSY